jgi:hypothetical protein
MSSRQIENLPAFGLYNVDHRLLPEEQYYSRPASLPFRITSYGYSAARLERLQAENTTRGALSVLIRLLASRHSANSSE